MADLEASESETSTPTRRRRRWPWAAAAFVVVASVFVLVWFQPQKLFIDDRVDEAVPVATGDVSPTGGPSSTTSDADQAPPSAAAEPAELLRGQFVSLDHGTSGLARVLETGADARVVRLEGLDTDNGPDLFLYLTANGASGEEGAFDDDYVNLGRLKGNQGDQNYELSADVDLGRYTTVVIWCDRFNSAFGAADLS